MTPNELRYIIPLKKKYYTIRSYPSFVAYDYKENKRKDACNTIGNWFLDKRYNPEYKYCRTKQWEDLENIYEEEGVDFPYDYKEYELRSK